MDPVWSNIAAPAPKWVISSIQIAPPTHFWVQNLENPQIRDPKMLKIMKKIQNLSGNHSYTSPAHSGSSAIPQNMFFFLFLMPNESPDPRKICDQDTKNDEKLKKYRRIWFCPVNHTDA